MKLLRKFKLSEMSIPTKLIITFLVIILPLYGVGLLLNEIGRKEVAKQISNNMENQLHNFLTTFENEIMRNDNQQRGFVKDNDLVNLSGLDSIMSEYERMQAINRLQVRIDFMKESSAYLDTVTIYLPWANRTFSSDPSNGSTGNEAMYETLLRAEPSRALFHWQDRLFLRSFIPNYVDKPFYLISIELSVAHIKRMLSAFNPDGGMILFGDDWSIANRATDPPIEFRALAQANRQSGEPARSRTFSAKIADVDYFFAWERSAYLNADLLVYVPQDHVLSVLKKNQLWIWVLSGISVLLVIVFAYGIYRLIHVPLFKLVRAFRSVEEGNFKLSIKRSQNDEFGYLYQRFEGMVGNLKSLIDELYVQRIHAQQSEFKQLQSQVNPHFLYNSFFILDRLIADRDFDNAKHLSRYLGDYYQYLTRNALAEMPLIREYNHARAYVEIQKIRFDGRIEAVMDELPAAYHQVTVPRLLLQPCIENAYEHGLGEKVADGLILIRCVEQENGLCVSIEDNGEWLDEATLASLRASLDRRDAGIESTGLINVHRRLRIKFKERGGVRVSRSALGGLKVEILFYRDEWSERHVPDSDR